MAVERQDAIMDVESVICHLKDVISARVVPDDDGRIAEVHVLSKACRAPKQLVRDIESAVMARLGIEVDHRKVSVAQVTGDEHAERSRLKFSDVSISLDGSRAEATVRLSRDGATFTGTASGLSAGQSQMKLIATAALRAVEDAGAADGTMIIEDLTTSVTLSGKSVAVTLVNMVTDRGDEYLSGSAVVKQDLWKAVVYSTLDAINRRTSVYD